MAHELEIINGEAQMFSVRQTPWHKLGKVLDNPPTSEEAIKLAGLDWEVTPTQIYYKTGEFYNAFPKRVALVRNIDNKPLSVVSNTYKPLQNREAFEWFDSIVSEGNATYETAGSLQGGKRIWVMAKLSDDVEIIKGDVVRQYILLCNSHDGISGVMIQPSSQRVVCQNTLNSSLATGCVSTIWHQGEMERKMESVKRMLGLAKEEFEVRNGLFKAMAAYSVNDAKIGEYVSTLIPDANKEATDRVKESVNVARERIWQLHEEGFGVDIAGVRGTMWGLLNAAVEYGEYDMPKKVRDIGNYQLFGLGAQFRKRAYGLACNMIGA
jgi:phage/plasmid-like protein (TIGR03299 family)